MVGVSGSNPLAPTSFSRMPEITLPDGSTRSFAQPPSVAEVARAVGPRLAKDAVAGKVGGALADAGDVIDADSEVAILTAADAEGWKSSAIPARTCSGTR